MATALYSSLHFLVDLVCAFAMFGRFIPESQGYWHILVYNFCAFALQMPFGTTLDLLSEKQQKLPQLYAAAGVALTVVGAFTHPVILGVGNALFHVGGGVGTIREDNAHGWRGQALGIFVAPGALGLFIGKQLTGNIVPVFCVMIMLITAVFFLKPEVSKTTAPASPRSPILLILCCFLVVILRSHVGMAVSFSWKSEAPLAAVSILAVVLGKMAGGILSARFGTKITILASLSLAAVCYLGGEIPVSGIAALLFFNMTMPITLYLLVEKLHHLPGFSFGLLTFALFLGFLPTYLDANNWLSGGMLGAVGSLLSLTLLLLALGKETVPA